MATDAYDRRAMDVFGEIAELPAGQRAARLDSLCSEDPALRDRVLTLLDSLEPTTRPPAENLTPSWFVDTAAGSRPRVERIGPYRLLGRIGVGGMSEVYEAEQDRPRRRVALKLIQPQRMTPMMRRRFEFEVEVLGRLEHPGIARVYDAGTEQTPYGPQPYFAMELVRGHRLDRWVRIRRRTLTQRLQVLTALCDAVQHAHQHGVIHRDLKPSNIIVTEDGTPKVLDFGVAAAVRVASGEPGGQTQHTATGQVIGTLQYMSPEQAAGDPRQLDTRADVYALGVIAYELLADRLPYEVSNKPLPEAVQVILGAEPTRLSTINRDLRGDLETIVFKAMEKEKQRRYASAAELGADVRRYLEYEPITARPPSLTYQLGKFARRHKALVGAVGAVFIVLVAGVIVSTAALLKARQAQLAGEQRRQESEWARKTSDEISLFLNDMLASVDPSLAQGKEVTVRDVLDRAGKEMAGRFDGQPVVEGELQNTIGRTYLSLGVFDQARDHLTRSVDARRRALGEDHPNTLASRNNLALALDSLGDSATAERVHRDVLATKTRTLGADHADTLTTMNNLACNLDDQGRFDDAQTMHRDALARRRRTLGDAHADTLQSVHNLGASLAMFGRGNDALPLLDEAAQQRTRTLGPGHPSTLASLSSYARALCDGGREAEAEPLLRDIVDRCRTTFGAEHANTLTTMGKWAHALARLGRSGEAERVCNDAIARGRASLGEDHPIVLQMSHQHATILLDLGRRDEAEQTWRALLVRNRAAPGQSVLAMLAIEGNLGALLNESGRFDEAEPLLRDAVNLCRTAEVPPVRATRHWREYARCLSGLGRHAEARATLVEAREQLIAARATHTDQMHEVVTALVDACEAAKEVAEATQWRLELATLAAATQPATDAGP